MEKKVATKRGNESNIIEMNQTISRLKEELSRCGVEREKLSENEKKFRIAFERARDAVFWADTTTGEIIHCNRAAEELLGMKYSDIIGKHQSFIHPPEKLEYYISRFKKHLEEGGVLDDEAEIITASGETRHVQIAASLIDVGRVTILQGIFHDITGKKEMEGKLQEAYGRLEERVKERTEELAKSEMEYRLIAENMTDMVFVQDMNFNITYVSPSIKSLFGYSVEEAREMKLENTMTPESLERAMEGFRKWSIRALKVEGVSIPPMQYEYIKKDGSTLWGELNVKFLRDSKGALVGSQGILRDITERRKAEKKLKRSEATLNFMLRSLTDHISMMDEDLNILWANDTAKRLFGDDIIGKKCYEVYHGRKKPCEPSPCLTKKTFQDGQVHEHDTQVFDKGGKEIYFNCTSNVALRDNEDKPLAVLEVSRDTTKQKKAEKRVRQHQKKLESEIEEHRKTEARLRKSEERFRLLFNQATDAIFILDPYDKKVVGKIIDVNEHALDLEGYTREELIGKSITMLAASEHKEDIRKRIDRIRAGEHLTFVVNHNRKDGTVFPVEVSAEAVEIDGKSFIMTIDRDITERRKTEETIRKRLEFEKTLSSISSRFVGTTDLDDAINQSLEDIGMLCRAGRAYLFTVDKENETMSNTHEWYAKGVKSRKKNRQNLLLDKFPTWMKNLKKGEIIHIGDVSKHGKETRAERELLEEQGIKSALIFPMTGSKKLRGFLGLDDVFSTGKWSDEDISLLRTSSEIITNAIEHQEAERAHRESEIKYRALVDNSLQGIVIYQNKKLTYANPAAARLFGYSMKELMSFTQDEFITAVHPEDRELITRNIKSRLSGKPIPSQYDIRIVRKDGAIRHIEMSATLIEFQGQPAIIVFTIDITERKTTEEEMKRKLMKFRLREGHIYLAQESTPTESHEAFMDLLEVGYTGVVFSRMPEKELKQMLDGEFICYWLAKSGKENAVPPEAEKLEGHIDMLTKRTAVLIDRLDYLISKMGFKLVLDFIQNLREQAYLKSLIVVVSLDPITVNESELRMLEKECRVIEPFHRTTLPDELFSLAKYIYRQNSTGIKPSYTQIGRYLHLSKPTVRKRIEILFRKGIIIEMITGRNKSVELTDRGRELFNK